MATSRFLNSRRQTVHAYLPLARGLMHFGQRWCRSRAGVGGPSLGKAPRTALSFLKSRDGMLENLSFLPLLYVSLTSRPRNPRNFIAAMSPYSAWAMDCLGEKLGRVGMCRMRLLVTTSMQRFT